MPKVIVDDITHKSILRIISQWRGKLTWKLLCERVTRECELKNNISRHTLLAYQEIEIAYSERKKMLNSEGSHHQLIPEDKQLENVYNRIDKLEIDKKRLQSELNAMREQVVRWMYNLYQMGLNMDEMNAPMPIGVNKEELISRNIPKNVDPQKLNESLPKITRAADNRRKRSRYDY
tara:strand:- start:600 stop:1130 length:531 start_codon:yes stop_codon:yes gene_type:complete